MMGEDDIRIIVRDADIDRIDHIGDPGDILGWEVEDLDISNAQGIQGFCAFFYRKLIGSLHLAFLVRIAGFAHDEHLDVMTVFDRLAQRTAAGDLDVVEMCSDCQYFHNILLYLLFSIS